MDRYGWAQWIALVAGVLCVGLGRRLRGHR